MKKILLYIIATVLMVGFTYCILRNASQIESAMNLQRDEESAIIEEFQIALCGTETSGEDAIYLKWWHHVSDGMYYFFVPKGVSLYWKFEQTDAIQINGKTIREKAPFELEEGTYTLQAEIGKKTKEIPICVMYSSPIATLFLKTSSGSMDGIDSDKENEETGEYTLLTGESLSGIREGLIKSIHARGNASWRDTNKKSYQIELVTEDQFIGLSKGEKWILVANAFDDTLLRNQTAFEIAKQLDLSFTLDAEFVDVYANGEYLGNYLLCEKIEVDKERINVADLEEETQKLNPNCKLKNFPTFTEPYNKIPEVKGYRVVNNPEDITGGYVLELDIKKRYDLEDSGFMTTREQCVVIKNPQKPSYEQSVYIAEKYQEFEDAVFATDGINPYTGKHYRDYIDVESFVKKYLIEEVTKNLDSAFTSQFIYKPEDAVSDLLYAGPVWDYDKSMGYRDVSEPEGLFANRSIEGTDMWGEVYPHENLWHVLYQHNEYKEKVIEIYKEELRDIILEEIGNGIGQRAEMLSDSAVMNAVRWELLCDSALIEDKENAYQDAVCSLKSFLNTRIEYLDQIWK